MAVSTDSSSQNVRDAEFALITGSLSKQIQTSSEFNVVYDTIKGNFKSVLETHKDVITALPADDDGDGDELVQLCVGISLLHSFIQVNWTGPDLDFTPCTLVSTDQSDKELNTRAIASLAYGGEPAYHLSSHPILLQWSLEIFNRPYKKLITVPWWRLRAGTICQYILDEPAPFPPSIFNDLEPLLSIHLANENPDLLARLNLEQGLLHHHYKNDRIAAQLFVKAARTAGLEYELTGALGRRTKFQQFDTSQLVLLAVSRDRGYYESQSGKNSNDLNDNNKKSLEPNVPQTLSLNDDTLLEKTEFTSSSPSPSASVSASTSPLSHLNPADQPALHPLDQCTLLSLCLNIHNTSPQHGLTAEQMQPYIARCISHPQNWSVHTMALLLRSRLESSRTRTVERSVLQLQALIDQMHSSNSNSGSDSGSGSNSDAAVQERLEYIHDVPMPSRWMLEREVARRYLSLGVMRSALEVFERLEMWEDVVRCYQALEYPEKGVVIVKELIEGQREEADHVLAKAKTETRVSSSSSSLIDIDKTRLAKLYCLLGDLEPQHAEEHYTHAWNLSNKTSSRAARSLGTIYFTRGGYAEALEWLRYAVQINPLLAGVWFSLGCAAVKVEQWEDAREAFSRVVSIDDENGESWSNLASVYLSLRDEAVRNEKEKKEKEKEKEKEEKGDEGGDDDDDDERRVTSSGYLILAHRALQNGLKYSYDSWRMWNNYMLVSLQIGDIVECTRAVGRIAEIRAQRDGGGEKNNNAAAAAATTDLEIVDLEIVTRLVELTLRDDSPLDAAMQGSHVRLLVALIGDTLIPLIPPSTSITIAIGGTGTRVLYSLHILHARLLVHQKRYSAGVRAHMDAYRASLGADVTPDLLDTAAADVGGREEERVRVFDEAVRCVVECVEALSKFGRLAEEVEEEVEEVNSEKQKKMNWQFQIRSILRSFTARMKDVEDEEMFVPGWRRLRQVQ